MRRVLQTAIHALDTRANNPLQVNQMKLLARIRHAVLGLAATLGVLLAVAALLATHRVAQAAVNCDVADASVDAEEQAFLGLINNYRAQNGAGPLTISTTLMRAATWMAVDMANKNYLSHTDSLGRDPFTRMDQCDVAASQGRAENVAAGYETAALVFEGWRNSPGHNANMLNPGYRSMGTARHYNAGATYGWYWASKFSAEVVQAAPAPNAPCDSGSIAVAPAGNTATVGATLVITGTGNCATPLYQFWVGKAPSAGSGFFDGDIQWTMGQAYSATNTFSWTPAAPGFYYVSFWLRNANTPPLQYGVFDTYKNLNIITIN